PVRSNRAVPQCWVPRGRPVQRRAVRPSLVREAPRRSRSLTSVVTTRGATEDTPNRRYMMVLGFIGLGVMDQHTALSRVRAGIELIIWVRIAARRVPIRASGAQGAATPAELVTLAAAVIFLMANGTDTDGVLGRGTPELASMVADHTIVY